MEGDGTYRDVEDGETMRVGAWSIDRDERGRSVLALSDKIHYLFRRSTNCRILHLSRIEVIPGVPDRSLYARQGPPCAQQILSEDEEALVGVWSTADDPCNVTVDGVRLFLVLGRDRTGIVSGEITTSAYPHECPRLLDPFAGRWSLDEGRLLFTDASYEGNDFSLDIGHLPAGRLSVRVTAREGSTENRPVFDLARIADSVLE
jgi:hypothetical protein